MESLTKIASLGGVLLQAAAVIWLIVAFVKSESGIEGKAVNRVSLLAGTAYGLIFLRDAAGYFIPPVPGLWGPILVSLFGGMILGALSGLTASGFQKGKNEAIGEYATASAQARKKAGLGVNSGVMADAAQIVKDSAQAVSTAAQAAAVIVAASGQGEACPPEAQAAPAPELPPEVAPEDDPDSFIRVRPFVGGGIVETGALFGGAPVITRTPVQIE